MPGNQNDNDLDPADGHRLREELLAPVQTLDEARTRTLAIAGLISEGTLPCDALHRLASDLGRLAEHA